ncbi:MAG TPA: hypothetical protein VGB15_01225 [Longimicrobium sp.]|jgi:hypothetical protein
MNRNRTGLALAAFALAAHAGTARAQQLPPARQIVDRYVEAVGGRAAIAQLDSRHMVGEMQGPRLTVQVESFAARPNRIVVVMIIDGATITTGYDGQVGWQVLPTTGPRRVVDAMELRQLLDNAQFDRNLDPAAGSTSMTTVGERTVAGRACWEVKIVRARGVESTHCYDKETGLLIGTRSKEGSRMGEVDVDAVILDYRDFGGVKLPTRIVTTLMGQQWVTAFRTVSHEPIPASRFEPPAAVRASQP